MPSSNLPLEVVPGVAVDHAPMAVISTEGQGTYPISVPVSASIPTTPKQLGSVGTPRMETLLTVSIRISSRLSSLTTAPLANSEHPNVSPPRRSQCKHLKLDNYYGQRCQSSSVNANIPVNLSFRSKMCPALMEMNELRLKFWWVYSLRIEIIFPKRSESVV